MRVPSVITASKLRRYVVVGVGCGRWGGEEEFESIRGAGAYSIGVEQIRNQLEM